METPVKISSNVFTNRANATLYVPQGYKAAYEAADYWKEFKEKLLDLGRAIFNKIQEVHVGTLSSTQVCGPQICVPT